VESNVYCDRCGLNFCPNSRLHSLQKSADAVLVPIHEFGDDFVAVLCNTFLSLFFCRGWHWRTTDAFCFGMVLFNQQRPCMLGALAIGLLAWDYFVWKEARRRSKAGSHANC